MGDATDARAELADLVRGKSDAEVDAAVAELGTDDILARIFSGMVERFRPERAGGQSAVVGWDVKTPDGVVRWQLRIADGACTAHADAGEAARVTLTLSLADFCRFVTGELDGMQAFMTGRLALAGDIMFAQAMQSWFAN